MSARAKRGVKKQYEEVESDIDMSETEREMKKEEQGENDQVSKIQEKKSSHGEENFSNESDWDSRPKKKQKKKANKKKSKQQVESEAKLSLLPTQNLDLITEIFTRLDLTTLVNIAELNKEFHHLLVNTAAGVSIFRSVRTGLGLPLLKGMSEIHFASLCFGSTCFECRKAASSIRNHFGREVESLPQILTRVRLCNKCASSDWIADGKKLLKELDDAHTRTREIVPHFIIASRYSHITMIIDGKKVFVDQAVEAMSEELFALEAKVRNQFTQGSGRPGRGQRIAYDEEKQLVKAALDEFIKKTRAPILEMKKESESVLAFFTSQKEAREAIIEKDRRERQRLASDVYKVELVQLGLKRAAVEARAIQDGMFTAADLITWGQNWTGESDSIQINLPIDDDEWERLQPSLIGAIAQCRTQQNALELETRQDSRRRSMASNQYQQYQRQRRIDFERNGLGFYPFPESNRFLNFKSVIAIWKPDDLDIDEAFEKAEGKIDEELMEYRDRVKTRAVLHIINSNFGHREDHIRALPLPLDSYNDEFFNRFTSQFIESSWRSHSQSNICTYQASLSNNRHLNGIYGRVSLISPEYAFTHTSRHGIIAREILKVLKLSENASMQDIKKLNSQGKFIFGSTKKALAKAGLKRVNYHSAEELLCILHKKNIRRPNTDLPLIRFILSAQIPPAPAVNYFSYGYGASSDEYDSDGY